MAVSVPSLSPEGKDAVYSPASSFHGGRNVGKMEARTVAGRYGSLCPPGNLTLRLYAVHTPSSL